MTATVVTDDSDGDNRDSNNSDTDDSYCNDSVGGEGRLEGNELVVLNILLTGTRMYPAFPSLETA